MFQDVFLMHRILGKRMLKNGSKEYLIKWSGYSLDQATWEPEDHVYDRQMIEEYENKKTNQIHVNRKSVKEISEEEEDTSEDSEDEDSDDEDYRIARRREKRKHKHKKRDRSSHKKHKKKKRKHHHRDEDSDEEEEEDDDQDDEKRVKKIENPVRINPKELKVSIDLRKLRSHSILHGLKHSKSSLTSSDFKRPVLEDVQLSPDEESEDGEMDHHLDTEERSQDS